MSGFNFKNSVIILSHCGYSPDVLAQVTEWCVENNKHPNEPWKIVFWTDDYLAAKTAKLPAVDAVERRLQTLYRTASSEVRARIRDVAGKSDKRPALELLKEHHA